MAGSMARMTYWLGNKARQYVYAFWAAALFSAVTVKVFWLTDPATVTALDGPYGAIAVSVAGLIAACIGINRLSPPEPDPPGAKQT